MSFAHSFESHKTVYWKAVIIGVFHQYLLLPCFAFLFVWLLQPSEAISLVIFLLVAFPNNRFSLILSWIVGGSTLYAVCMGIISMIISLTLTPFILYALISWNPSTENLLFSFSYVQFIELLYTNRIEYFCMIVPSIILGVLARKRYYDVFLMIEQKVIWIALFFSVVFTLITVFQRPLYFSEHWDWFAWEVLFYNIAVFVISFLVARLWKFGMELERALTVSSAKNFIPLGMILLFAWFPLQERALWILSVQVAVFQWSLLLFAFLIRYKMSRSRSIS